MEAIKSKLSSLNIDFVGKRRYFAVLSGILVLVSWVLFFTVGPQWGIDFTGGTELQFRFDRCEEGLVKDDGTCEKAETPVSIGEIRDALVNLELGEDALKTVGDPKDQEYVISIQDPTFGSGELQEEVRKQLGITFGEDWLVDEEVQAEVGVRMVLTYDGDLKTPKEIEEALSEINGVTAEESKEVNQVVVKLPGLGQIIQAQLTNELPGKSFEVIRADAVGPKVGGDLTRQGFLSIGITLILVLIYVAFRFDIGFSPGAVLALAHDVSLTIGVFIIVGLEINLAIIGALLTIVGYSLNDTIVIYDRIRENGDRYARTDLPDLINVSINETMARTIATSVTTFLAICAFLFMGGATIQAFAFAMLLGIVFGTYSTVYVASPMILVMQDVKPWLMKLIVIPGLAGDGDEPTGDDEDGSPAYSKMTQSEQRRRERAKARTQGKP